MKIKANLAEKYTFPYQNLKKITMFDLMLSINNYIYNSTTTIFIFWNEKKLQKYSNT